MSWQTYGGFTLNGTCLPCCAQCDYGDYMLLPPLTEATGDWYADCATADAVLTNPAMVSNCVGYIEATTPSTDLSITATNGGTTLDLSGGASTLDPTIPIFKIYGSVNIDAAGTLSVDYSWDTLNAGISFSLTVNIYDDTGTLVGTDSASGSSTVSGTFNFSLDPAGRYIVEGVLTGGLYPTPMGDVGAGSCDLLIYSGDVTVSVNPIKALYDVGGACADGLICGESCP